MLNYLAEGTCLIFFKGLIKPIEHIQKGLGGATGW